MDADGQGGSVMKQWAEVSLPAGFTLSPPAMGGTKRTLRRAATDRRARAADEAGLAARQIADHFIAWRRPLSGDAVAVYWPIRSELDTRPLIRQLHEIGCRVGLPVVTARATPLTFRMWTPQTIMEAGAMGIDVPPAGAEEVVPRTVVAPLLAFDRRGYRLGYCGGYYDRTLAGLRDGDGVLAVGVGYAAQEVAAVPVEDHDARLDAIVTEAGVLEFGV